MSCNVVATAKQHCNRSLRFYNGFHYSECSRHGFSFGT